MRSVVSLRAIFGSGLFVLLGALLAAQLGGVGVEAASMQTRTVSCTGLNFHPIDSHTEYGYYNFELIRTSTAGDGYFYCDPGLPNKAVVTKVQFTLNDQNGAGAVEYCGLFRNNLDPAHATEYQPVAQVPSTGGGAFPGTVRLSTSSITNATIDNSAYAYWLQCKINTQPFYTYELGIYGATVTFKISSANG